MKKLKLPFLALAVLVGMTSAVASKKHQTNTRYVFNGINYVKITYNAGKCQNGGSTNCSYIINVPPAGLPASITPSTLNTYLGDGTVTADNPGKHYVI